MDSRLQMVALAMIAMVAFVEPGHAGSNCGSGGVYVFDAPGCPYCKKVKALLGQHGIAYTAIDTANNNRARAFMAERFNTTMVPVTVVDDTFVIGFNEPRLREVLCLN